MKKALFITLCVFILIPSFSLICFAALGDVQTIISPLNEPLPSIEDTGSGMKYTCYFMRQDSSSGSILSKVEFTLVGNQSVIYYQRNYNQWYLWCDNPVNYTITEYDIVTGSFIAYYEYVAQTDSNTSIFPDQIHVYAIKPRPGYFPSSQVYNSTLNGAYYYLPDQLQKKINNSNGYYTDWIQWAPDIPVVHTYKSFCSEPISDELNRYFILAGTDQQYLYCIHYFLSEFITFNDNIVIQSTGSVQTEYQFNIKNLFCPYVDLNNYGLELSLNCDGDLLQLLNANGSSIITYDIQVAKYNLVDGSYVASYVFSDIVLSNNKIPLNIDLGDAEDYDSAKFYGVMFQDTSTQYHLNFLACTWALDPDFISWRETVSNYLDLIYRALTESSESVTVNNDLSAYDEMQSARDALQVTDANGQTVDAAAQVEIAFSEAASGIGDIGEGVSSINGMITQLLSSHPLVVVPLVVALALGLIVTILGKNKSD